MAIGLNNNRVHKSEPGKEKNGLTYIKNETKIEFLAPKKPKQFVPNPFKRKIFGLPIRK